MSYQHILIAVDLNEDSEIVARKASTLAGDANARLSLLHVVEYVPVDPAGEALLPPPVNMEDELMDAARERLDALAGKLDLPDCRRHVVLGNIKTEVTRFADENDVDLIVLGSHERHGLSLLLGGSTGKSVLASAPCDLLAIRLRKTEET
jgi:universal stress protein A